MTTLGAEGLLKELALVKGYMVFVCIKNPTFNTLLLAFLHYDVAAQGVQSLYVGFVSGGRRYYYLDRRVTLSVMIWATDPDFLGLFKDAVGRDHWSDGYFCWTEEVVWQITVCFYRIAKAHWSLLAFIRPNRSFSIILTFSISFFSFTIRPKLHPISTLLKFAAHYWLYYHRWILRATISLGRVPFLGTFPRVQAASARFAESCSWWQS